MPLDTSIPLQVQIPQFAEPIDPATRQYNALRQQALQQEMMRNQLIMQNTMEDRRLAAAQRAQAAAQAAAERRRQEEMVQVLQSGYRPAREAVMGPGTIQGSTPEGYDFSGVTNAMLQRGNIGAVESLSKLQQQIAGQQKAEAEVPGAQAVSRKQGAEADKAEFANAFDQMSVLAPYVANGAIPARVAADALLRHPVAGKLLSSTMTREEIYDFADKNPQAVAQILATPPDKIYESLAAPTQGKGVVLPPGSTLVNPVSGQLIAKGEPTKKTETEAKAEIKDEGRKATDKTLDRLLGLYTKLNEKGYAPPETKSWVKNLPALAATTETASKLNVVPEVQTLTQQIRGLRLDLMRDIKNATGMSAQEMNSNVELQLLLNAATDPNQNIEAVLPRLADFSERYGTGKLTAGAPPAATAPSSAAPASNETAKSTFANEAEADAYFAQRGAKSGDKFKVTIGGQSGTYVVP